MILWCGAMARRLLACGTNGLRRVSQRAVALDAKFLKLVAPCARACRAEAVAGVRPSMRTGQRRGACACAVYPRLGFANTTRQPTAAYPPRDSASCHPPLSTYHGYDPGVITTSVSMKFLELHRVRALGQHNTLSTSPYVPQGHGPSRSYVHT